MYMTATAFPHLRASMGHEYAELSDEQLDALVGQYYGVGAEAMESFWNDVGRGFQTVAKGAGRLAQQAAPVLARTLPAVAQGAISGASVGGPFGAIAGAVAGGAGSALSQSSNPTLRGIGGAIGGVTKLASGFTPGGALSGLAGNALGAIGGQVAGRLGGQLAGQLGGQLAGQLGAHLAGGGRRQRRGRGGPAQRGGSANALLGMLSRPETLRALSSAAMGAAGRSQVLVGSQPVGVQSILSALGGLAGRAASEAEAMPGEALPAFFYGADGELAIDPADADQRIDALLELFAATPSPLAFRARAEAVDETPDEAWDESEPEYSDQDALNDEWLLANEAWWSGEGEHDEFNA